MATFLNLERDLPKMKIKLIAFAAAAAFIAGCATTDNDPAAETQQPGASDIRMSAADALIEAAGSSRVYFGFDRSDLTAEARQVLRRQADFMKANPNLSIRIEGHCDERGTREYNLALGARRANASRDFLVGLGVDPSRITTISFGKDRPLNPVSSEAAWAQNRNTHTVVSGSLGS